MGCCRVQFWANCYCLYISMTYLRPYNTKLILPYSLMIPVYYLTSPNIIQVQSDLNKVFGQLNKCFKANLLSLNFNKTYFIQFISKSTCTSDIQITYEDQQIRTAIETKFLGLFINITLSRTTHIEHTQYFIPTLQTMQPVKLYVSPSTLKMIYYSFFHSVMTYGLLFWAHTSDSIKIFRLQKKIIRIMMGCRSSDSLFFNLEILPLPSQYILSLLLFMMKNRKQFMVSCNRIVNLYVPHCIIYCIVLCILIMTCSTSCGLDKMNGDK